MKDRLYILADVSTISGILSGGLGLPPWHAASAFARDDLRHAMTEAVNTAIRAAHAQGIEDCLIHEACPLDWPALENAAVLRGAGTLLLDGNEAGLVLVGQGIAAAAPPADGETRNIEAVTWNDRPIDEASLCALFAAARGVPVLFAHGTDPALALLREWWPGLRVGTDIGAGVTAGLRDGPSGQARRLTVPITVRFRYRLHALASLHSRLPGIARTDARTTQITVPGVEAAFDTYRQAGLAAAADWTQNPHLHASNRE